MKQITIEEGDVEVTVENVNNEEVMLSTTDGGNNYFKPLEAIELGKAMIAGAMQLIDFPESSVIVHDLRDFIDGKPVFEFTSTITLREIFDIDGNQLQEHTRAYMRQRVAIVEHECNEHGGMATLRVRFCETFNRIEFVGNT